MTKKKVSSQLKKARALVNKGWTKGRLKVYNNNGCSYCAIGALNEVTSVTDNIYDTVNEYYWPCCNYLIEALKLIDRPHYQGTRVEFYNDHPSTTKQNILDLYDVAIKLAQADEAKA